MQVPVETPGIAGGVYLRCSTDMKLAITVAIGMNLKRAEKIVRMIQGYSVKLPVTLFVYGDFVETFPSVVKTWATRFDVQMREDGPYPLEQFSMLKSYWTRESIVSAELRLREIGIQPSYYFLPVNNKSPDIIDAAKRRGFRMITPNVMFPPTGGE